MDNSNVIEGTVVPSSQMNLAGVLRIPAIRQVLLLFGVAAAVAAGFAIVLWSRTPVFTPLYSDLNAPDAADVAEALRSTGIEFKIDSAGGGILVPESRLYDARMQLASAGVAAGTGAGMSMLNEQSSFGTSQFMETARYQHALETELARTISSLGVVREARVHLALPKQTTFIRDQKRASASVLLHLLGGQTLESDKATAIVNLVASSVPNLATSNVTLIDQYGRLLSSGDEETAELQAASQFRFARRLEETYRTRIEQLLTPLVGPGRVRAQVDADVDFTISEEARETFDPASTVVRSEQLSEDTRSGSAAAASGVPGALSNQPPETGGGAADETTAAEEGEAVNTSRSSVRNFEVDRTVSHTRPQAGTINKLSVAVLVDDSPLEGEQGAAALSDADIARYETLVKEAVGFNEARGDTVVVVGAAFRPVAPVEQAEGPPIWEKPMVREIFKQVLGAALALALVFGVVRPMLRGVMASGGTAPGELLVGGRGVAAAGGAAQIGGATAAIPPPNYEEKIAAAKNLSGHDPARVAQVVKQWVNGNE